MAHNIKISADFTSVKKSITEISSSLKDLSKRQAVSIFDKESIGFLKGAASDALSSMQKDMDSLTAKARQLRDEYRQEGQSLDVLARKKHELLNIEKERVKLQGDINRLEKGNTELGGRGGFGSSMLSQLGKIPGIGRLAGLGGLGMGAIAGLGIGAGVVGAGYYGYRRGKEGYGQYMEGLDSRIQLRGRGVNDVNGLHSGLARLGYSPEELRQAQLQATEGFGAGGAGLGDVYQRARFAKSRGLDLGQVQGVGTSLRSSMGVDQASRAFAMLQGNVISKGIKDAVGPYLETAASMLTDLNENGMGFDRGALDALGNIVSRTGVSAERAAGVIQGTNANIQGATGERSAFYQTVAAGAGLGNGTLGGSKEAANLGLFGLDPAKAKKMLNASQYKHYQQMGLLGNSGYMKRFVQSIENTMPKFPNTAEGDLAKGRFLEAQGIGHGSAASALSTFNLMKTAANGGRPGEEARRKLQSEFGSPEENMKRIMGDTKQINEIVGMKVAPLMAQAKDTLNSIDRTVLGIAQKMGVALPQESGRRQDEILEQAGIKPGQLQEMSAEDLSKSIRGADTLEQTVHGRGEQVKSIFGDKIGGWINQLMGTGDFEKHMEEVKQILKQQLDVAHSTNREAKKPKGTLPAHRKGTR